MYNDVYADAARMSDVDLVLQCMTMSEISGPAVAGLRSAVEAGTGLAGWHGGIADSYRNSSDYLQLVGGQFATHPGSRPITSPAVGTRLWGAGRIFVATPGHSPDVLADPTVRTIVERGLLWASRPRSE